MVTTALFECDINVGDNKPLVKFPPMSKRRLLQLLPGIIGNSDRQAQTDGSINLRDQQMWFFFFHLFDKENRTNVGRQFYFAASRQW